MVILGVMSGTSLDGVDLAACRFEETSKGYSFEILAAETIPYEDDWKERLNYLPFATAEDLVRTDWALGAYFGELCAAFLQKHHLNAQLIASHGHTVFHNPSEGYSCQIGKASPMVAKSGLLVVNDFRSIDVALGGQGAPLVPIGDHYLFGKYEACLNLGGIANISFADENGHRVAFDIGPCNMLLNYLSGQAGLAYDEGGKLAAKGKVSAKLMKELDAWEYYKKEAPKSLGREQIERTIFPLFDTYSLSVEDKLATASSHIAGQIDRASRNIATRLGLEEVKVLITGGGAYNATFISQLKKEASTRSNYIIPEAKLIEFKEALVFAFLGYLRMRGKINVWKDVTGAKKDNTGGAIYGGNPTESIS